MTAGTTSRVGVVGTADDLLDVAPRGAARGCLVRDPSMLLVTLRDLQHRATRIGIVTLLVALVLTLLFLMTGSLAVPAEPSCCCSCCPACSCYDSLNGSS